MAGIFPPAAQGGVPPGPNADNGYDPGIAVTGEGPLYVSNDCTTALVSGQINALASEILSAVDRLGGPFNADKITNLGDALVAMLLAPLGDRVKRAGDTMTGVLALADDPDNPLEAATKQYVDANNGSDRVLRAGDTMTGVLVLVGNPADPLDAAPKQYVDANSGSNRVLRAGDAMTGPLVLPADPATSLEAATKQYVDGREAALTTAKVARAGDSMSGPLLLSGHPTGASPVLQAATKKYVDDGLVSVTAGTSIVVIGPELTGNGLSGTPVIFNGITHESTVFGGNGLSGSPLTLLVVDGGQY